MNVNASLKRVCGLFGLFLSCSGLFACGGIAPTPPETAAIQPETESSTGSSGAQASALESVSPESVSPQSSRVLLESSDGSIGLQYSAGSSYDRFVIQTQQSAPKFNVSRISAPDRLVVDITNQPNRLSRVLDAGDAKYVSNVRLGAQADGGRVVFDLRDQAGLSHRVDAEGGNLVVTIETASDPNTLASAAPEGAAPSAQQSALAEEGPAQPEIQAAASPKTEEQFRPALVGLRIEPKGKGANRLVAEMESAGFYTFKRTAQSEYVLTLESAQLSPTIEKAILAPQGSGSIRAVRPVVDGSGILLRIFASPEALLRVQAEGSKIIVGARNDMAAGEDASAMMAQAEIGEEKTAEAAPGDAEKKEGTVELEDDLAKTLGVDSQYTGRLISLDLQDTDIDNALRIIAEVSNLNIIASQDVTGKVTLRLIDVPWDQALDVILKTNGLDKVQEGNVIRIAPVDKLRAEREALKEAQTAAEELESLRVKYIRISYAKAASLQPLVDTVLTERGSVAYDERSNQLIVKDIKRGVDDVVALVEKLDLRTPQVLIETQIVEANRKFVRELGSELGFWYLRSPATGNATGWNFPNSVAIGGSAYDASGDTPTSVAPTGSFFPSTDPSSAVSMLFGSADGTKGLNLRLSQAESEGNVKIVSRPSVAVTNNTPAVIKSVEKLRIKLPSGGVSVATGQGATAAGTGGVATEVIEVGIVLNVTAQASPDYYVLLDIQAKSSTLGIKDRGVDDIPPEIERSANSTVLVSSGQTFAMGGIYRISEDDSIEGVPFLKDIPFLGHFFRRSTVTDSDEELIFFLTPRIIEGSFDDAAMRSAS